MNTCAGKLVLLGLILLVVLFVLSKPSNESYREYQPGDYKMMSRLPWCTPPTGIGALGERQCLNAKATYPGKRFSIGKVPISVPPSGIRIYETGNAENPNTHTSWGVVGPEYITY